MKKAIITVLAMLFACSIVFAATIDSGSYYYNEPQFDDFLGFNVGASFVYETYETEDEMLVDKALQFYTGFSEFAFFNDAAFGVYIDAGILLNINDNYNPEKVNKSPAYADVTLGLAYRMKTDSRTSFLLSFGPEFTYFTDEFKYLTSEGVVQVEKTYMTMGLTLGAEATYRLGGDWYVSLGGKGSVMFLKWMTKEEISSHGSSEHTYDDGTDGYFGYRIVPKVALYYKF